MGNTKRYFGTPEKEKTFCGKEPSRAEKGKKKKRKREVKVAEAVPSEAKGVPAQSGGSP